MRARRLLLHILLVAACRPAPGEPTAPEDPVAAARPAAPSGAPNPIPQAEPTPTAAAEPEPAPTWEWAISVLPELAAHSEVDAAAPALARFLGWFSGGTERVHLLVDGRCHAIAGEADADGFHGGWHRRVTVTGNTREVSTIAVDITRSGISESGPGGKTYERDARGRWREVGAFGTGSFSTLVDHPMSAADHRQVTFAGYWYRLEPVCRAFDAVQQTCSAGGTRTCRRCTEVSLVRRAEGMAWSSPTITVGRTDREPVDCARPCPLDERVALLPHLAAVLKGREFVGASPDVGPSVFRSAKDCDRERRRRPRGPA